MHPLLTITTIVIAILLLWTAWGIFSSRVEQAAYTITSSTEKYEIRRYPVRIVAQVSVKGTYKEALYQGFRIIAGYIFGGNIKKESIAMTAPVVTDQTRSEPIAMTAPVTATTEGSEHVVAFFMPRSYTLETLPKPNDARVELKELPEATMGALRFSWYASASRVEAKTKELLAALAADNVTVKGEPQYAGYNDPWTAPWMMHHEILVAIE